MHVKTMIKTTQKNLRYHKTDPKQRGAVLLIAVTIAALILSIGLGILDITRKEIILSAFSKESGKAFYAADTGIECALFWDINYAQAGFSESPFATSSVPSLSEFNDLVCAGQKFNDHAVLEFQEWNIVRDAVSATTTFKFSVWSTDYDSLDIDNPCVEVFIEKYEENIGIPIIRTKISAIGYNTCDENKKRRVSRGIRVRY